MTLGIPLVAAIFRRTHRWLHDEGWLGSFRKIRHILLYWRFRMLVSNLRKQTGPVHGETGRIVRDPAPLFSILLPAFRTRPSWLREAVDSVRTQSFGNWELCIGLCEVAPEAEQGLRKLAESDSRIRIFNLTENLGISGNANSLAREATGEFLAVLDHDDYLEPNALEETAVLAGTGRFDFVYTDEDIVSPWLKIPSPPNLKPDWAPESFLSCNYICHFCCYRRNLFEEVGGFRAEYDGSQDYDLFLRLIEKTERIAHVPKVLYHWRRHGLSTASGRQGNAKPAAWDASVRAVASHLQRTGKNDVAEMGAQQGTVHVSYARHSDPTVDIIIPSMNKNGTLVRCLDSILNQSRYPNYRVTVMLNGGEDFTEIRKAYGGRDRIRLRDFSGPFNFSRINNVAVREGEGGVLLFLNDDVEITEPGWLEGLLAHATRDEIGAVGPMLLYPNRTIQHAGISLDPEEVCWEFHRKLPQSSAGYNLRVQTVQNVSAVTGACLCTRRNCFLEVGGFDEGFPLAYNDVDYCIKLLEKGYRNVYTPFVRLVHHESLTRGLDHRGEKFLRMQREKVRMREKWGTEGLREKYFDPRLFRKDTDLRQFAIDYQRPSVDTGDASLL